MINAAIVGLGRWGKNLVDSVQGKSDHLQFTHGVVPTPSTSRDYAARHAIELSTEFDRVLDDKRIEAVVLTTPHTLHTEQIIAAAQAGKAVFCEKPLALRRADAERAIEACRAAGVVLGLGHNKRFWPSMQELKRLVEDRELGRILHIEGHFSNESTGRFFTGWRGSGVESPGGGLTATGIHVIDAFMGLVGPAQRVTAHSVSHESLSAPVDTLTVFMEMANRVSSVSAGLEPHRNSGAFTYSVRTGRRRQLRTSMSSCAKSTRPHSAAITQGSTPCDSSSKLLRERSAVARRIQFLCRR